MSVYESVWRQLTEELDLCGGLHCCENLKYLSQEILFYSVLTVWHHN